MNNFKFWLIEAAGLVLVLATAAIWFALLFVAVAP